jgi:uncharacterized glyoxalase superfamily protein PhnB
MAHIDQNQTVQQLFPYLIVRDCPTAIEFYKRVFHAEENMRLTDPDGRIGHAELKLGPAMLMLAEERPNHGIRSPLAYGGAGSMLHLHVANVDEVTANARPKSKIPSVTSGCSASTSKTSLPKKCSANTRSCCHDAVKAPDAALSKHFRESAPT